MDHDYFISRVRNITEWRDKLDQCLRDLNLEISVQKDAKEACERALEAKNMPLEIALENLNTREGRQEFDVVKDEVEAQLQTEVQLIENIKDRLKQRCEESWDCLAKLEEIREIVELDLKDKTEALDIDMTQLDLSENSANISHKPDATRIPKGSVQPETWYTYSENNKMLAEQVPIMESCLVLASTELYHPRPWQSLSDLERQYSTRSSRPATI